MGNATKRMKEKKQQILTDLMFNKSGGKFVSEHIEEIKEELVNGNLQAEEIKEEQVEQVVEQIEVVESVENVVGEGFTKEELDVKLKSELVTIAESLGLDSTGTKTEIINRLLSK